MAGLTQAVQQQVLNDLFPNTGSTDHIAWSVNGSGEFSGLARTPVGATGWNTATGASPSVKAMNTDFITAEATEAGAVSHFAIYGAGAGGTQKTDWEALDSPRTLAVGDRLSADAGVIFVTLD